MCFYDELENQTNRNMMIPEKMNKYEIYKVRIEVDRCVVVESSDPEKENKSVAIKCIPIQYFKQNEQEVDMMYMLGHPNIIKCIDRFCYPDKDPRFFAIVMPQASSDLYDRVDVFGPIDEWKVRLYMINIINALFYMHQSSVCHRDIKPDNLLIMDAGTDNENIAVGDLGHAIRIESQDGYYEGPATGTIPYAAPELIEYDEFQPFKIKFKDHARCL